MSSLIYKWNWIKHYNCKIRLLSFSWKSPQLHLELFYAQKSDQMVIMCVTPTTMKEGNCQVLLFVRNQDRISWIQLQSNNAHDKMRGKNNGGLKD